MIAFGRTNLSRVIGELCSETCHIVRDLNEIRMKTMRDFRVNRVSGI